MAKFEHVVANKILIGQFCLRTKLWHLERCEQILNKVISFEGIQGFWLILKGLFK